MRKLVLLCSLIIWAGILPTMAQKAIKGQTQTPETTGSAKRIINTPLAPKAIGPFSQAVEINGILYISGQLPLDPASGQIVDGGINEQVEQVMKNIGAILKAAGYDYKEVVKSTCMLNDMDNFKVMNEIYGKYYPSDPPTRATFAVVKLPLGALIEIETVAIKQK